MCTALYLGLPLAIVALLYSLLIIAHIISWIRLPITKSGATQPHTKVSIIIPARNEEKNIAACINSVLAQDYPTELIELAICNDQSTDKTKETALSALEKTTIKHQFIDITASLSNKKKAIEAGISATSGELIIITDADCTAQPSWISSIVTEYERTGANMLCGPVVITQENSLCTGFQALELCGLSLLSGAGINAGFPLLCNGANLAYTRSAYNAVEGFKGIDDLPTGDDILMLFKINKQFPGSIRYLKSEDAMVYTKAQATWKDFFQQRIRWASKGLRSKNRLNSSVSLLVFLSNFVVFIYLILAFIYPISIPILLSYVALKSLIDFLLLTFGSVFFRKRVLLLSFPVAEMITILYTGLVGLIAPYWHYQWKGRNY
jgi:cellulose synthase/poly-beta-1,6-N-acetylglucosamine synthase-like glycosyltransferase